MILVLLLFNQAASGFTVHRGGDTTARHETPEDRGSGVLPDGDSGGLLSEGTTRPHPVGPDGPHDAGALYQASGEPGLL